MDCKARGRSVLLHPCLFHHHSHLKPIASTFQKRLPSSPCIKNTPATNISSHPRSVWRRSVSDTVLRHIRTDVRHEKQPPVPHWLTVRAPFFSLQGDLSQLFGRAPQARSRPLA